MTKSEAKTFTAALAGDAMARHRAMVLLEAAQARGKRHAVKAAPRKRAERATRTEQRQANATTRAFVFTRSAGKCEVCHDAIPTEWSHLGPAALRRRFSDPANTCASCITCHRGFHHGDLLVMEASYQLAGAIGAHRLVLDGIRYRIDKINRQRTA